MLGDAHFFDRACSFTSPRFHLRPGERDATKPPDGPCPELAEHVHDEFEHRLTASDFWVENVTVKGRTADAVTSIGRAELEVVGGEWRVLWLAPK